MSNKEKSYQVEAFFLKQIIDNIPLSIYWKNAQGIYLGANGFVARMAGLKSADDIVGKTDADMVWSAYLDTIRKNDELVIFHNQHVEIEEEVLLANDEKITMLTNKIPLRDRANNIIGVIGISVDISERKKMEKELTDAYVRAKEMCATLEENRKLLLEANKKLEALSRQDGLTGLANRRGLDDFLSVEWLRSLRKKSELSVVMFDVDDFKRYNDTYGHLAGDEVLKNVSAVLKLCSRRPADLVARIGGEEFIAVLPDTSITGAQHTAEEVRQQIEKLQIPHSSSTTGSYVTVSIGCASIVPKEGVTIATLIAAADTALYAAKNNGKNRVYCHLQEQASS